MSNDNDIYKVLNDIEFDITSEMIFKRKGLRSN